MPDLSSYPWVYLRDGQPPAEGEQLVSIIAVGDVLLGRGVGDETDPLRHVGGWLSNADLTLGNLEGAIVHGGAARQAPAGEPQPIILRAEPEAANLLPQAGFDIISLANNHSLDYGEAGLQETISHLQQAGIDVIGVSGAAETAEPLIREVNGLRLAFLAFNAVPDPLPQTACPPDGKCRPRPWPWGPPASSAAIAAARDEADAVIVSVHWGYEYQPLPDPRQETIARAMFDAGADLIIGHHPHVPQTLSAMEDQVIAYSLGNFLFDQEQQDTRQGLALRALFDGQGLRAVQALPLQAGLQPHLLAMNETQSWLPQLLPPAARTIYACGESGCTAVDGPQMDEAGRQAAGRRFFADQRFYVGQIDLTGDGRPETVRRTGEQITVYEGGEAVWHSPKAWRVGDVALGDPNDDGRYEIMLAIRQKDAGGHERSQPYIVGHRGGRYDLLWGGRPVADPIQELSVGDVDDDGIDELVVIEELADGSSQALSIWRWTGWTFTLVWRSDFGSYADLVLVPAEQGLLISLHGAPSAPPATSAGP